MSNTEDQSQYALEMIDTPLDEEMRRSYLDYAMSVIVGRALPDARDGLKPVHRRVLHSMNELNNDWNKPFKKSARVVGDTIGKYHPHGDTAVYDTIVRMAQSFSLRYLLVDGQGNFGSIDGDSAAAMRYTEIRLSKLAHALLADIDKGTVDFGPNYDGSEKEPLVLPTRLPNLLLNGSEGIAVGMATRIAPHNLNELLTACIRLLDDASMTVEDLIKIVPAPDFPTGGLILGLTGAAEASRTGRGSVVMRARTHFEDVETQRPVIVVDELPYQVNKKVLQEKIAELVNDKKIEGIANIQDESDKSGIRLVIELKKGEIPEVVLNQLYKNTELQTTYSCNYVALVDGRPRVINLKEALEIFIAHRREIFVRKTLFELHAAKERGHILEGFAVAVSNMDDIVSIIKQAKDPMEAKDALLNKRWGSSLVLNMITVGDKGLAVDGFKEDFGLDAARSGYLLSPSQVHEILQLRLQRLTGMEQDKIVNEYQEIVKNVKDLTDLSQNDLRINDSLKLDFKLLMTEFGDERRSEIVFDPFNIDDEDLIPQRELIVTLSHVGYVKTQSMSDYNAQRRGGRGKLATDIKEEDLLIKVASTHSHATLLCFTNRGRALPIKAYALPEGRRNARGRPFNNLLPLQKGEKVLDFVAVRKFDENAFLIFCTHKGITKKTSLSKFANIRANGLNAIDIDGDDQLLGVCLANSGQDIMVFSSGNRAIRFTADDLRSLSRTARGVKSIKLSEGESVVSMLTVGDGVSEIFIATEFGYAKRVAVDKFRSTSRTASGVRPLPVDEQIGKLIKAIEIHENDDVCAITKEGILIRSRADEVRALSRNAKGTKFIKLQESDILVDIVAIESIDDVLVPEGSDGEES